MRLNAEKKIDVLIHRILDSLQGIKILFEVKDKKNETNPVVKVKKKKKLLK